jgi:hypothetical protein
MREEDATASETSFDFKAAGYLVSIASVLLLGAVAWPAPQEPDWVMPALILGMAASVLGMGLRYVAHIKEKREIQGAKRKAAG